MKQIYLIRSLAVSVILCSAVQSNAADLGDGLVANYSFSGNTDDASGNGYDGTVYGASLTLDRFGNADSAYQFDGYNDRIDLPAETLNFERTNAFSQSLWVKSSDSGTANNIIAKMTSSTSGINLVLARGFFRFQLISNNESGNRMIVRGATALNDGQWHHVVATYDGSSMAAGVNLYFDGIPETMVVGADALTGSILNNVTPTVGSRNNAFHYTGAIDDVRIYNRPLSAEEAADLYVIPEPATLGLFGLSGLAFCMFRRMRIF